MDFLAGRRSLVDGLEKKGSWMPGFKGKKIMSIAE